jgi:hypothetical protein
MAREFLALPALSVEVNRLLSALGKNHGSLYEYLMLFQNVA